MSTEVQDNGEQSRYDLLVLVPLCPFIAAYVHHRQDDYLDLVVPSMRGRVMEGVGQR